MPKVPLEKRCQNVSVNIEVNMYFNKNMLFVLRCVTSESTLSRLSGSVTVQLKSRLESTQL